MRSSWPSVPWPCSPPGPAPTGTAITDVSERLGIQVPADELLFFPTLPRRIDDVTVKVGDELSGPVMTVSNLQLAIDSAVSSNDAKLIRQGAPVAIEEPDLGITADWLRSPRSPTRPGPTGSTRSASTSR